MYSIEYDGLWDEYFNRLSLDMRKRVWKKILQIQNGLPGRHLKFGVDFFVEEVGQYRICYKSFEEKKNGEKMKKDNKTKKDDVVSVDLDIVKNLIKAERKVLKELAYR